MSALLPCRCGTAPTLLHHRPFNPKTARFETKATNVECVPCGVRIGWHDTEELAIAAWNRRAPAWQPIATAPKDGTVILAYNGERVLVRWSDIDNCHPQPTHWFPLPSPPDSE